VQVPPVERHVAQVPLAQMLLQHSLSAVQEALISLHAHLPVVLSQLPLQH
jgi:hypothetical protein